VEEATLLQSKLSHPRTSRWHLPRKHLTTILEEGLGRRLTMLIAAAGHGKTTTLAHFLPEAGRPYVWLQLDQSDSDLRQFALYLSAGVRQELNGGDRTYHFLEQGGRGVGLSVQQVIPLLVADLQECGPGAVVLDDFHLIDRHSPVVELVHSLIQHGNPGIPFFISSRFHLPFPTARLKATLDAASLSEEDLRFTPGEVLTYCHEMAGVELDDQALDEVCRLTEGWPAALVLLASAIRRKGSLSVILGGRLPSDLFEYLAEEVYLSLSPELQQFMEESSILDACSPAVCDAVLGRRGSSAVITALLNSNLLLTQLGTDSFRYHHLMQRFLQERLKLRDHGEAFSLLHKRAGDLFLQQQMPEEAVKHFLRGGWIADAASLVEELAPIWLRTNRLERLRGLLSLLPSETKEDYPWISLCEARYQLNAGSPDAAMGLARLALRAFQERGDTRGVVHTHTMIGEIYFIRQQYDQAALSYQEAEAALRPDLRYEEGVLLQRRATLEIASEGVGPRTEADVRRALAIYVEFGDLPGEAAASELLGNVRARLGDQPSTIRYHERAAEILRSLGEPSYEVGVNLGLAYTMAGRFKEGIALCEPMLASSSRKLRRAYAATNLVHSYTRLGEFQKAAAAAQAAHMLVEELGHKELKGVLTVDIAAMYRLSGRGETAIPYANEALQLARQTDRVNFHTHAAMEAILLHLFHTGNAASAARMAEKALSRLTGEGGHWERVLLTLMASVAEFRLARTESRPYGVRLLQEGLAECSRRGYEVFALHEWQLAMAVVIYGLSYGERVEYCLELLRLMQERLPVSIRATGFPLAEPEARLIPAAWQALPDEQARALFSGLLSSSDRRRVINLASGPVPLRVHSLGPLTVTVGADPIDVKTLKKRKSGQLLVLLLAHDGPVPRDQLMDKLWPDLDGDAADTSLRVSLHHLRRMLEPHLGGKSRSRYIQAEGGLVWFSRHSEVQVDLDLFRDALARAEKAETGGDPKTAAAALEEACRHYRGDLCAEDPYAEALAELRETLRQQYMGALDWLGHHYWHEIGDTARAILLFRQRLSLDEASEPAHQALLRLYLETGQVAAARQQYMACKEALARHLGVAPSRATESLLQLAITMEAEAHVPEPRRATGRARRVGPR
jgi:LuxR family transcriptional regulator, maltose regulon positive regulatory protein